MKQHNNQRRGSAMVFGLVMVLMVSGMIAAYLMSSLAQGRNIEDAGKHQEALYVAQSGISQARWLLAIEDSSVPDQPDEKYSFTGDAKGGTYYVTITRKTDSYGHKSDSAADDTNEANDNIAIAESDTIWAFEVNSSHYDQFQTSNGTFTLAQSGGLDIETARIEVTRTNMLTDTETLNITEFDSADDTGITVDFGAFNIDAEDIHTIVIYVIGNGLDSADENFAVAWESRGLSSSPTVVPAETPEMAEAEETSWVAGELEGMYEIISTGIVEDVQQSLTAIVELRAGAWDGDIPETGIIFTNENLTLNGVTLSGDGGAAHTNANGYADGTVDVALYFDAVDTLDITGTFTVASATVDTGTYESDHSAADVVLITDASSAPYLSMADYVLVSEGANEGKILVVSTSTYIEPETIGWRYGQTIITETVIEGEPETTTSTDTLTTNQSIMGSYFGSILCDGNLKLSGNLTGNVGNTHSNGDTTIQGSAVIAGTVTANGNIIENGQPDYESKDDDAPVQDVPVYDCDDFLNQVDFTMDNNGVMIRVSDGVEVDESDYGWRHTNQGWKYDQPNAADGVFWVDDEVTLNQGNDSVNNITIFATNDVKISSGMTFTARDGDLIVFTEGNLVMNSNSTFTGAIKANGNIDCGGTATLNGAMISYGNIDLGGNFTVNGNHDVWMPENDSSNIEVTVTSVVPGEPSVTTTEEFIGGVWELYDETTAAEGIYYGDCRAIISAAVGSLSAPFDFSIALTGSLEISGDCILSAVNEDLLMMIEGDLYTSGSPTYSFEGVIHVGEQIALEGAMTLDGILMSAGQANLVDYATTNRIEGAHTCTRMDVIVLPTTEEDPELGAELKQLRKSTDEEESENIANFE